MISSGASGESALESSLTQASIGALASVISNAFTFPLDLVVCRMQTSRSNLRPTVLAIAKQGGGIAAFYRGFAADSLSTLLSNFIFFLVRTALRKRALARLSSSSTRIASSAKLSARSELAIGMVAGLMGKLMTSPLSNIATRQQQSSTPRSSRSSATKYAKGDDDGEEKNMMEMTKEIIDEKGFFRGLWSGYSSAILLTTNPAITYFLIDRFSRLLKRQSHLSDPLTAFLASSTAAALASFFTYPLILCKTLLQSRSSDPALSQSLFSIISHIIQQQGLGGLYIGLEGQMLKTFISEGVKMMTKERIELGIGRAASRMRRFRKTAA